MAMFTDMDVHCLMACLGGIAPVELKAVELLRQLRPLTGAWFPQVPVAVISEATVQLITYTKACADAMHKLQALPPVMLCTYPCQEFCL